MMEAQQERPVSVAGDVKNRDWPTVPSTPIGNNIDPNLPTAMEVDGAPKAEDRTRRATSVLSMDDIEAAQALEGLRSGNDDREAFFENQADRIWRRFWSIPVSTSGRKTRDDFFAATA